MKMPLARHCILALMKTVIKIDNFAKKHHKRERNFEILVVVRIVFSLKKMKVTNKLSDFKKKCILLFAGLNHVASSTSNIFLL
jgi:hypothetical protein